MGDLSRDETEQSAYQDLLFSGVIQHYLPP